MTPQVMPGMFSQLAVLFVKEIKVLMRDRQALILLFLMPAVFIFFLSLAFKNVFTEKMGGVLPVALESADNGDMAVKVADNLRLLKELSFVGDKTQARAVIRIPAGFATALDRFVEKEGTVPFEGPPILWEADPVLDATYRWFLDAAIGLAVQEAILDSLGTIDEEDVRPIVDRHRFATQAPLAAGAVIIPTPLQQTVPGWSLFAMFFIVVPLSGSFIRERHSGTMRRLMISPVPRVIIVAGKLAPYLVINCIQFGLMLAVGILIVPLFSDLSLQLGAHPGHLPIITLAAALAATGYGVLVATLSRTIEQAGAFGAISIIIMAVAGGVMVPTFVMPVFMQKLAYLSPLYWGLQAYLDVFLREASFGVLAPRIAILALFGLACLGAASLRFRSA